MVLGITGAFGCGKSVVLASFAARNWRVADADLLCHELYADPDGAFVQRLAERWGKEILTPAGVPDRRRIGAIVFADEAELGFLTGALYPELSRKFDLLIERCRRDGVDGAFELPLLFEVGWETKFDRVAAIWASPEIRHDRLRVLRGYSDEEIRQREEKQLPADVKLERADYALINNGGHQELTQQVDRLIESLKRTAC